MPNKERELNWIQVHFAPINRPLFPVELSVHSLDVGRDIINAKRVSHEHPHIRIPTLSIT